MSLINLEDVILSMGVTSLTDLGMPEPERIGQEYRREACYDIAEEQQTANEKIQLLTQGKAHVYAKLNEMVELNQVALYCFGFPWWLR